MGSSSSTLALLARGELSEVAVVVTLPIGGKRPWSASGREKFKC